MSQIEELTKTFGSRTKGLEIFYLLNGLKQVVRHGFYDKELPEVEYFCKKNHLALEKSSFKILLTENNGYSNKGIRVESDYPEGMLFVYIAKTQETAKQAKFFEERGLDLPFGLLLGYPRCCVDFFCHNFNGNNTNLELKPTNIWTNTIQRNKDWVLISHFPCSSDCRKSVYLAQQRWEVVKKENQNLAQEMMKNLKPS